MGAPASEAGESQAYDRDGFLAEFFPRANDRQEVEAGAARLVAANRASRLAETCQPPAGAQ